MGQNSHLYYHVGYIGVLICSDDDISGTERAQCLARAVSGEALPIEQLETYCPENGMILANCSAIGTRCSLNTCFQGTCNVNDTFDRKTIDLILGTYWASALLLFNASGSQTQNGCIRIAGKIMHPPRSKYNAWKSTKQCMPASMSKAHKTVLYPLCTCGRICEKKFWSLPADAPLTQNGCIRIAGAIMHPPRSKYNAWKSTKQCMLASLSKAHKTVLYPLSTCGRICEKKLWFLPANATIGHEIIKGESDPYLGGASRTRVCSHGGSDTPFSSSTLENLTREIRYLNAVCLCGLGFRVSVKAEIVRSLAWQPISSSLNQKYYKPSFAGFVDVDLAEKKLSVTSLIDHSVVESRVFNISRHAESNVELTNMQLKPEAFNALKLPINVKAGFLGSVKLNNWSGHRDEDAGEQADLDHINQEDPTLSNWNIDTGVSSHLNDSVTSLSDVLNMCLYPSVLVGDGYTIPVTNSGHSILPTPHRPRHLNYVLITPNIIKNLKSVRQFVCDNNCTVEFDALGFSVKDFMTRQVLPLCNSTRDLYPVTKPSIIPHAFLTSQYTWHQCLGHPGSEVLRRILSSNSISCAKEKPPVLCNVWQTREYLADDTLSRYKARLVANGSMQLEGIDVDETFSPVVKLGTIRTVLSLATSRHWRVYHLDVKNAFLHDVYLRLQRTDIAFLLLYVDDIVLTASSEILLQQIITSLHQEFSMTNLDSLNYFLGISVTRDSLGMFLSQRKYATEILKRAYMLNYNSSRTLINTESKPGDDGDSISDPTLYRSYAGSLQYLTFTRPDISYAIQQICLYMHDPREPHFSALKRVLRYVRGTLGYELQIFSSFTTSLVAYSDVNWAGCPITHRSTSGYCVFLGNNLLSWSSKRQPMLSHSSSKTEYCGVANAVAETCWLMNLLCELHTPFSSATLLYCDNVRVLHVLPRYQFADIFTK
ncbi:ribonuclease H-like domain-containing protein [Tanacetum coccineum]